MREGVREERHVLGRSCWDSSMDTPQKSRIGTPGSKFEDSPVFNYLSNLSPIKAVKSIHVSQSFTSLNLTSPSSVFTSPHVSSSLRESSFLKRHRFSDQSRKDNSDKKNLSGVSELLEGSSHLPETDIKDNSEHGVPAQEADNNPEEESEISNVLPQTLEYEFGTPSDTKSHQCTQHDEVTAEATGSPASFDERSLAEGSVNNEHIPDTFQNTPQRERLTLHWDSVAADAADPLIQFTPNETRIFAELFHKSFDQRELSDSLTSLFLESTTDSQDAQPINPVDSLGYGARHGFPSRETSDYQPVDGVSKSIPDSLKECNMNYASEEADDELVSSSYQGLRRRCLVFDASGVPRKGLNSVDVANHLSFMPSQPEERVPSRSEQSDPRKPNSNPARAVIPGFGLHLNALATANDEKSLHSETPASKAQISASRSTAPVYSPVTFQEPLLEVDRTASSLEDADIMMKDTCASEDDFLELVPNEELNQDSPRKKRQKFANAIDAESCKRCNCKKSKCLKLYCECFAAGVYCIEPCSCRECLNKPIHEDIVLATRKQIESRNPLAFAPKVMRASQTVSDHGDEDSNTPASARHKRGCNCKKSSCLKKYCECYQGGVGCSLSCRCESCKNTYGRKDGSEADLEIEAAEEGERQKNKKRVREGDLPKAVVQINKDEIMDPTFPATASRLSRLAVKLQFPSKGKPMRSSFLSIGSSSVFPDDTKGVKVNLSSIPPPPKFGKSIRSSHADEIPEVLQNQGSPSNNVKSNSPNGKRISPPQSRSGRPSPSRRSTRKLILQAIPSFPSLNQQ